MESIVGVEIEKNAEGQDAFVRIDLNKYGKEIRPFLEEIGVIEETFEEKWKRGLTVERARDKTIRGIRERWNR